MYPSLIQIRSKTAEKTLHKQTNRQTDRQTNRHYENNGHLAVNQNIGDFKLDIPMVIYWEEVSK